MTRRRTLAISAIVGTLGLGVVVAVAVPGLIQSRVKAAVDELLAANVDADVTIGQVDVSLFRSFPNVSVDLKDVRVAGRGSFEGIDLARLPELELGIELMSAISGRTFEIAEVRANGGHVHVVYDREGRANWDVLPESDGQDEYRLKLEQVVLSDLDITYEDRAAYLVTEITDVDGLASAELTQSVAAVDSNASIASLTMRYAGMTWLRATRWESQMKVDIDQQTGAVTFGENAVRINDLPLTFQGVATPTEDSWDVDIGVEATDTSFAALLSLVPDAYSAEFADVDASGKVRFKGTIDGEYDSSWETVPALDFDFAIEGGRFQFPDLPSAVERVSTQASLKHPGGDPDLAVLDARHFELAVGGAGVRGRLKVEHPMTDPLLDTMVDGRLDLGALRRALPQAAEAPEVDGTLDLDFTVKGRMSDFEKQRVERIDADGTIRGKNLRFDWYEQPVEIDRVDLALSPLKTQVNALQVRTMGSDLRLSGNLDNVFPWLLTDADLSGRLGLTAGQIDLRPFQGEDDEPSEGRRALRGSRQRRPDPDGRHRPGGHGRFRHAKGDGLGDRLGRGPGHEAAEGPDVGGSGDPERDVRGVDHRRSRCRPADHDEPDQRGRHHRHVRDPGPHRARVEQGRRRIRQLDLVQDETRSGRLTEPVDRHVGGGTCRRGT